MVQTLSLCRNITDPLVHHGCHFSRTVHALSDRRIFTGKGVNTVFQELLRSVPGLEECLMAGSEEEVDIVSELLIADINKLSKGTSGARDDDTKSLKGAVLDWITPRGQSLVLPLAHNMKVNHSFNHKIKAKLWNGEIVISGDQWPLFLYVDYQYDSEDPWNSLFCSAPLVSAYKHVFTSPMFSHTDTVMNSEQFYNSLLELFEDPDAKQEVDELLVWNRQIFPAYSTAQCPPIRNSVLARIQERCACIKTTIVYAWATCVRQTGQAHTDHEWNVCELV
ncbi:hypothetical protein J3A83DRAFT_4358750 [Scleroderma citrinum]